MVIQCPERSTFRGSQLLQLATERDGGITSVPFHGPRGVRAASDRSFLHKNNNVNTTDGGVIGGSEGQKCPSLPHRFPFGAQRMLKICESN